MHSSKTDDVVPGSCNLIIEDHEEAKDNGTVFEEKMEIRLVE